MTTGEPHHRELARRGDQLVAIVKELASFIHEPVGDDDAPLASAEPFAPGYATHVRSELERRNPARGSQGERRGGHGVARHQHTPRTVSYTHLRAHETDSYLV